MKRFFTSLLLALATLAAHAQQPVDYVNPMIGTTNYGATHPGAVQPRGMVSVVPFNTSGRAHTKLDKDSDWVSFPYLKENGFLTGFSHVNLSGVGCPDLGVLLLMPTAGELQTDPMRYGSTYSQEKAQAGYYSARLDRYGVQAEVTATPRAGVSRFTFPKGQGNVLLNLATGLTNEAGGYARLVSPTEVEGMRMVGAFCYAEAEAIYPVYFVMRVSKQPTAQGTWHTHRKTDGIEGQWMPHNGKTRVLGRRASSVAGDSIGVYFSYQDLQEGEQVEVQVGVSYVSVENARENLLSEVGDRSFEQVRTQARDRWNQVLSRIRVEGGEADDKTVFYTALYHTMMHPNVLNDVNGDYPKIGSGQIGKAAGKDRYTVFSLWDTYRNANALVSLVYPGQQSDMVKSMLQMYQENGWLPKWELNSTETFTMVGDPAASVIADTYVRGIRDFDAQLAWEAVQKGANQQQGNPLRPGISDYLALGYVPVDAKVNGNVSVTQEYCIADFGIAQLAGALGKTQEQERYMSRAQGYRKLYDKESGFLRPRHRDGKWYGPFDPQAGANFQHNEGYIEGNAWQYRFMCAHDAQGLIKLMGGGKAFVQALDRTFADGHYDMANEPDMVYPYLYNQVPGQEWRTQQAVREQLRKHFRNTPNGIAGNDDTGTMSAWVIFSMMGIYPDVPALPRYTLASPVFDKVTIELDPAYYPGKTLEITATRSKPDAWRVKRMQWNGKTLKRPFVDHATLVAGGRLHFELE